MEDSHEHGRRVSAPDRYPAQADARARHADHKRELEETRAKWSAEVSALREAMSKNSARLTSELQIRKARTPRSSVSSTLYMSSWSRRAP